MYLIPPSPPAVPAGVINATLLFPKSKVARFSPPRCINSMMGRITEAMINLRKRVDVVDVLIIENNQIGHLPARALGSVAVNRLFIEHNGTID